MKASSRIPPLLKQAYAQGGLSREDVVTALGHIEEHLETRKSPLPLTVLDWSILQDSVKRYVPERGNPNRSTWVRLHFTVLILSLGDLSRTLPMKSFSYWDRLAWLEQIVTELSPRGFVRTSLIRDSDPEFSTYVIPLIALTTQVAREMGAEGVVARLARYREPAMVCKLIHFGRFGPVTEPHGIHATIAFI